MKYNSVTKERNEKSILTLGHLQCKLCIKDKSNLYKCIYAFNFELNMINMWCFPPYSGRIHKIFNCMPRRLRFTCSNWVAYFYVSMNMSPWSEVGGHGIRGTHSWNSLFFLPSYVWISQRDKCREKKPKRAPALIHPDWLWGVKCQDCLTGQDKSAPWWANISYWELWDAVLEWAITQEHICLVL